MCLVPDLTLMILDTEWREREILRKHENENARKDEFFSKKKTSTSAFEYCGSELDPTRMIICSEEEKLRIRSTCSMHSR